MKDTKQQKAFSRQFTRRNFLTTSLKAGAAAFAAGILPERPANADGQYNVLFIIVDDLRPLLGCYGYPEIHTPNIDALAQRGTLFNRAYCQYPLCNPSRTSILTGLRSETTSVTNNRTYFRQAASDVVTLPQHFRTHGYHTQSIGRVHHHPDFQDDENSWSVPSWRPLWQPFDHKTTPSWQALDVDDDVPRDGKTAKRAIQTLEQIKHKQFFLTVGFYKPHLPYNAPKKYFELYENKTFNLPPVSPEITPEIIPPTWNEIRPYEDVPSGTKPLSYNKILELIRAYAATTSYVDAQVGRILDELDVLGLTENTVIAFCGDHGYNLGENGTWGKNVIFDTTLRSPLIVSVPGQVSLGQETDALVELVDIYPTLCDACQLPIPSQLEGLSLTPVIEQPTRPWKTAAFSQLGRGSARGQSMRTERYRYTEWGNKGNRGIELYDYDTDPYETVNIADLPENAALVAHLSERLHTGWRGALPDVSEQISVPQTLPWDINSDGIVDFHDLVLVSNNFGTEALEHPKVDVNKDGSVDIIDLLIVAAHFGESGNPAAPSTHINIQPQHLSIMEKWLTEARLANDGSAIFRQGIATLETLVDAVLPTETMLLPNYPNPLNPETWIPYDLAEDADAHIYIYNLKGELIRELSLGFQTAGTYRTPSRAAYWDGRNAIGEPVASGIYFYTLQAGNVNVTRQMVILK